MLKAADNVDYLNGESVLLTAQQYVAQDLLSNFHMFFNTQCSKTNNKNISYKNTIHYIETPGIIPLAYTVIAGFVLSVNNKELPLTHQFYVFYASSRTEITMCLLSVDMNCYW